MALPTLQVDFVPIAGPDTMEERNGIEAVV